MNRAELTRELRALRWWIAAILGPALVGYCTARVLMLFGLIRYDELAPGAVRWDAMKAATGMVWGIAGVALLLAAAHDHFRRRP